MFNLSEIINSAQDGKAVENLAQQFGITPDQAQAAVQALIPAISSGLLQKAAQPGALGGIISAITDPDHHAAFANADAAQSDVTAQKGSDVVSDMFGSSHIANQIAQQASAVTGLRPDVLMQMLPVLVSIVLGGIAKSAQNQGFGGMLGQLASAAQQGNLGNVANQGGGGLMGMLASLFGGLFGNSASPQSTLDNLTKMFQPGNLPAEISQSGLTDQIGKILSGSKS
ncbi:MAG: DUF937 domain-containing protein [Methylovirgula sp.]